jgi:hypothetical protein
LKARILAYGEAHNWPRLPLAYNGMHPYLWLIEGETAWHTFVTSNPNETLRLAVVAIEEE